MKYFIRSIKYFVYACVVLVLVLTILSVLNIVEGDVTIMFRNGYNSLWQIGLAFLAVSFFYPKFGYTERPAIIPGEYSEIRGGIISYMEDHGYRLESEEGENLTFTIVAPFGKLKRMFEDRISFRRELPGYYIEGLTKDVVKIVYGLEYRFRSDKEN